jgi:hypothetical protein
MRRLLLAILFLVCASSLRAQTFYVSTTGNDANAGTTIGTAWRTIQHSMNAATAGSTVNIIAGTYHERLTMGVSGSSGNIITFQPNNFSIPPTGCGGYTGVTCGGDSVILDYSTFGTITDGVPLIDINGKSFVTIQGLTLQNFTTQETSFIVNYAIRTHGSASAVTLQYLKLLTFTELGAVGSAFQHGIWCDSPASMTVQNNELGNILNHDSAIQWTCSGVTVANNWLHDIDQIGIDAWNNSTNYTVSHNKLEYVSVQRNGTPYYGTPAIGLYNDGGNNGVWDGNSCNHCGFGIVDLAEPGNSAAHDIKVRNNIVQNSNQTGLTIGTFYSSQGAASVFNINIWNNTFYNNSPNVAIPSNGFQPFTAASVTWENNIFFGSSNYSNAGSWATGTTGYNVYAGGGGTGPGSNNVTSDPLFAYVTGGVFTLSSGSPALNAGDPATSSTNAGTTDFLGGPRFLGTSVDMGAVEGLQTYFAQTAQGANNGADCADAFAYNDGTHGWNVAGNWVAGNTLHTCATVTIPTNTTGMVAAGSGTSSSPITVLFEPGAVLQSARFNGCADGPFDGSASEGGAIDIPSSRSFIILDGGTNGVIQNTANGTGLANSACSLGIWDAGDNIIVRNVTVKNIYNRVRGTTTTTGGSTADLFVSGGATSMKICNNTLNNASIGAELNWHGASTTPGITTWTNPTNCQANTFPSGAQVFGNNTLNDHNWMASTNGAGAPVFVNNQFTDWSNWNASAFHQDGVFTTGNSAATFKPYFINNYMYGDQNQGSPSGMILYTDNGVASSGQGQSSVAVGNIFYGTGAGVTCCQGIGIQAVVTGNPKGPYQWYNNTFINFAFQIEDFAWLVASPTVDNRNNIWLAQNNAFFYHNQNTGWSFSTLTVNGSSYFGGRQPPNVVGPYNLWTATTAYPGWLSACVAGSVGGALCDTNSSISDPLLAGESSFGTGGALTPSGFIPASNSAAVNLGDNLTSQCASIPNQCASMPQTVGAGGSCGTGCTARPGGTTRWTSGAFQLGSAPNPPIIGMSPSPANFSNQNVGTTSGSLTLTVSNTGASNQVLATPYFTITGANSTNFANTGTGTCANGGIIAPSASCTVNLTFTPSATGARTATFTIQGTVFATDTLNGTGIAPVIAIAPSPVAFGNQNVSSTSGPLTVTISNTGTASETLSTPFFTVTGTNAADFARSGGTCTNAGTIAASSSCTILLTFTPAAIGARLANLNISGTVNALASITGTGVAPFASLSRLSIAFANQTTNTSSGNQSVTLTNTGNATLTIGSISLTGTNAAEFSTNGSTCGASLAASSSCSLNVVFTPVTVGSKSASLVFVTNAASSPDSVALSGTGVLPAVPVIGLAPSPGAFGNQLQGTTSGGLTITVSNTGNATEVLATPFFTITGTNPTNFARSGGTCANAGSIAASASCTIILTFTPSATGARSATLNIQGTVNASDSLTGTGTLPVIGLAPSPAAFGNQNVGSPSSPLTVTVSNTGTATQTLSTPFFTITGANAGDFARSGGTCANAGSIATSASCTIILTFTPAATGSRSATLTIQGTVNATDSLTGTGIASAVTLAPTNIAFGNQTSGTTSGNTAVTLTNSGTATLNITSIVLTGTNAAEFSTNGSTCGSTLAAAASCGLNVAFSPVSTGAKTASLTFTTDAASSPNNVTLTGTGTAVLVPSLSFSPTPLNFGSQTQGIPSSTLTLTVSNTGTASEVLATPYFTITGANASSFANTGGGTCANAGTIVVSGSCTILLTFTPSTVGALAATVNILGTVNGSNGLAGTGTPVAPSAVTLSPTVINYGNQDDGTSSPPTSVSLTNSGTGPLTITSILVTGANATEFSINTNTCGASLASSASCTWNVVFSPATAGSKSASVTVTTNAATSPDAVTLTGTGRVPTPPTTPAPAITIVNVLPPGSVLISDSSSGIKPRNILVSSAGCSQDGVTYSNPCKFLISCGNCSASTKVRWSGTLVNQTYVSGVITASVPIALIPQPSESTKYQFSLMN